MMTLFEDTELFASGMRGRKSYEFPDCDLLLIDNFIPKDESDFYYTTLLNQTKWYEYEMPMYEKIVTAPRMVSWYGDSERTELNPKQKWSKELLTIRKKVEHETTLKFNAVLLNLYRNGNDGVGWHSDKTISSNTDMNIASLTFGETRMFRLRHKFMKHIPVIEIPLYHGTFLLMSGATNSYWEHQVPKTTRNVLPRINLTFRQVSK